MYRLVPIFIIFISVVTTRTEPINFNDIGINDNIDSDLWNKVFSKTDDENVISTYHPRLEELLKSYEKINPKNRGMDPRDWGKSKRRFDITRLNSHQANVFSKNSDSVDDFDKTNSLYELSPSNLNDVLTFLMELLKQPSWEAPIVVIDETPFSLQSMKKDSELSNTIDVRPNVSKKSRYYRGYPFKREHSRYQSAYDSDSIDFCMPSRNDIYHLLDAIRDLRLGNKSKNVRFCNRRRTAGTLLTHVRFIGRRK